MNQTASDKNTSSETKEIENLNEETLLNERDLTIVQRELVTTSKDEAKTLDNALNMIEIPSKGGDTIIDILTEKHLDPIIEHRQKSFWVYFGIETTTEPNGAILDYGEGDRNDFVRLVFLILTSMLAVTTSYVFMVMNIQPLKDFMKTIPGLIILLVCMVAMIVIGCAFCCSNCTRRVPTNWITIILTTIVYSFMLGSICTLYAPHIVVCAAGTTFLVSAICLGLAFTSFDFTKFILIVVAAMLGLMTAGIFLTVLHLYGINLSISRKVTLVLATITSAAMLVIEFQMILGGKAVELGEEDYCYAAYLAYTSILDIFLKLLRIYSEFED